jgi:cytochrome c-type biogenesis protein CcmH
MRRQIFLLTAIATAVASFAAYAVQPDEILPDAALEARARKLDQELRCVVCQSQSLAESDAPLAKDMRVLLREKIAAGASDKEAIAFLVDRYGEYVLLKPRLQAGTILLWTLPGAAVAIGGALAFFYLRRRRSAPTAAALSADEEAQLNKILEDRQ